MYMIVVYIIFSFLDTSAKYIVLAGIAPLFSVWMRFAVHVVVVLFLLRGWREPQRFRAADLPMHVLRGSFLFGSTICNFLALQTLQLAEATSIYFFGPMVITALAGPLLGEWAGWRRWLAILAGFVGVLIITSEYGTGTILSTFAAIPQRRAVLAAKAIAFTTTTIVLGIASSFAAFFVFQACLAGDGLRASLDDPGVLRAVVGGGLYVTVLGLLGLGLGTIIRSSAGAIAALFGLLFVPPLLIGLLPPSWQTTIRPYVPMEAGSQIFIAVTNDPNALDPWVGFGIFAIYAAVALIAAFILIRHRDA